MLRFILKVVIITSSGVFSPGPLTASTIALGVNGGWKSGFKIGVGHMAVELPYIFLIALNIALLLIQPAVKRGISLIGGLLLVALGYLMLKDALKERELDNYGKEAKLKSPYLIGSLLSALNPYFLVWWIFVGGTLVIDALSLAGYPGIIFLFISHIWMDFLWFALLAELSRKGKILLKTKGYKVLLSSISLAIILFGADFISYSLFNRRILPL